MTPHQRDGAVRSLTQGAERRQFLHVDDAAAALVASMAAAAGRATAVASSDAFWAGFWAASSVDVATGGAAPNATAQLATVERFYYFMQYLLGCTTLDGKVYGMPHIWGTEGLVVNTKLTKMTDYTDLCRADVKGKVSMRLKRPTLISFAFAAGKDPFALYNDPKAYTALMEEVGKTLTACKSNVKFYWDNKDQLLNGMRTNEIVAAQMWDTGGWKLNGEIADIQYLAPKSGATGWIDTFAIPAKGRNDAAAYAWINFNMRPEIAAKVAGSAGNFTASKGADQLMDAKLKAQFAASFPEAALKNIKWYPAVPAGLEEIEGRILDRVKAAP